MSNTLWESFKSDLVKDFMIYLRFALNYLILFAPCYIGALATNTLRKLRGMEHVPSTKRVFLAAFITTPIVQIVDYFAIPETGRNEGLSIATAFIGGVLSYNLMSALLNYKTAISLCKSLLTSNALEKIVETVISDQNDDDDSTDKSDSEDKDEK